jgi:hypothetical protein
MQEFNSLSVVYGKPSSQFISADHMIVALDAAKPAGGKPAAAFSDDGLLSGADDALPRAAGQENGVGAAPSGGAAASHAPAVSNGGGEVDLLGADDLLGLGPGPVSASSSSGSGAAATSFAAPSFVPPSAAAAAPAAPAAPAFALQAGAAMDPATFQSKWTALPTAGASSLRAGRVPATAEVEALARAAHIYTIASGDVAAALKFYLYARDTGGAFHLLEVVLDKSNGAVTATIKSDNPAAAPAVAAALAAALRPLPVM